MLMMSNSISTDARRALCCYRISVQSKRWLVSESEWFCGVRIDSLCDGSKHRNHSRSDWHKMQVVLDEVESIKDVRYANGSSSQIAGSFKLVPPASRTRTDVRVSSVRLAAIVRPAALCVMDKSTAMRLSRAFAHTPAPGTYNTTVRETRASLSVLGRTNQLLYSRSAC